MPLLPNDLFYYNYLLIYTVLLCFFVSFFWLFVPPGLSTPHTTLSSPAFKPCWVLREQRGAAGQQHARLEQRSAGSGRSSSIVQIFRFRKGWDRNTKKNKYFTNTVTENLNRNPLLLSAQCMLLNQSELCIYFTAVALTLYFLTKECYAPTV